jgi:hypothetical protein
MPHEEGLVVVPAESAIQLKLKAHNLVLTASLIDLPAVEIPYLLGGHKRFGRKISVEVF